jgi:hypothetical protein
MKEKEFIYNLEEVENTNPSGFSTRRILFLYIIDKERRDGRIKLNLNKGQESKRRKNEI